MKIPFALARALPLVLVLALQGAAAAAQQARATFVALPEAFPPIDARAIVVRDGVRDVVLLRAEDATPETLAMSLIVVRRARERAPSPENGEMIPITGFAFTAELPEGERVRLAAVLERLGARPVTDVGTFGPGRWIAYRGR